MVCAQCGKVNPEGARFCAYCGGMAGSPKSVPVTTSMPVRAAAAPSRTPILAAVAAMLVVGGSLAFVASRLGPIRGALGTLTGQSPHGNPAIAEVQPGSVPGSPGVQPALPNGAWGPGAQGVQSGTPGALTPGGVPPGTSPGAAAPSLMGANPANAPASVSAGTPGGSITAMPGGAVGAGNSVAGATPGGLIPGTPVTGAMPGGMPRGMPVTAGTPGSMPTGSSVAAGSPGNPATAPPVTAGQPGSVPAASPVTGGNPGAVPRGAPVTGGSPGGAQPGRPVTGTPPGSVPTGPSVNSGRPETRPSGRGVQGGLPERGAPERAQPQRPSGPSQQERNLVAEYLRRLAVIQATDNQLNQQIGGLGGGWMESASGLQGLEDPGQFLQQYGGIAQGFARVGTAKQNVGNQFLRNCGPIAAQCQPVQNLHNWYIRYFQEWVQATQALTGALQGRNLGMAMQVQSLLSRAENTERQCQREEDRLRDRYDIPQSPFGPR